MERDEENPRVQLINDIVYQYGGTTAFAAMFGVTPQAVSIWMADGFIPERRAIQLEVWSGGDYKASDLCNPRILEKVPHGKKSRQICKLCGSNR